MPDTLGPVEVEFTIPDDFGKQADAAIKKMAGLTDAAIQMPKATKAGLMEQKEVIKLITSDIDQLEKAMKTIAPGKAKQELIGEVAAAKQALAEETAGLKQMEQQLNATGSGNQRLMFQIRDMTDAMAKMRVAGQQDTQEFKDMELKASELNKQLLQTRQAMRSLSDDQRGIKGITEGVSGLSGAFSAGVGAIGLFAGENENLQKIQTKVQSLMAITIGLQQVANVLDGESAFMSVTVARAKQMWVTAEKALTTALWGSNIAAKALMATVTLGLAVAIPVLIGWYDRWNEKQAETAARQKESMRIQTEASVAAGKARIELDLMISKLENFTGSKEAEKRMLKEVNDKYGDTFGTYKTLAGWLDVLKGKAEDYVEVMFLQATVQGFIDNAVALDKKAKASEASSLSEHSKKIPKTRILGVDEYGQEVQVNLTEKEVESAAKKRRDDDTKMYERLRDEEKRKAKFEQDKYLAAKNKLGDPEPDPGLYIKPGGTNDDKQEQLNTGASAYQQLIEQYQTYADKRLDIVIKMQDEMSLAESKGDEARKQMAKEAGEASLKALDDEQPLAQLLEKYKTYDTQIKEVTEKSQKEILDLKAAGKMAEAEMAEKAAAKEIEAIGMQKLKMSDAFGKLWEDVGGMTGQQIKEIIDTANQNLADLNPEQLIVVTALIEKLGKKLDDITDKSGGTAKVNTNNPFAVIADSIKKFNSTDPDVDKIEEIEKAFRAAAQAVNELLNDVNGAVDIMADLGVLSGKEADAMKETVNQIGGVVQGGMSIAAGIMTGNPVQVITGVVQAAGNLVKLLDFKGKNIAKDQSAITAEIGNMERAYKKLDTAVKNALGTDKYKLQLEQFKLNTDEMAKYQELINLEMQKKKKKQSQEDIDAWNDAIAQLQEANQDITDSITEQLTQTNAGDFAKSIADSIVGAFDAGTDATLAWGEVVNNVMRNAVVNAMKLKYLEKPIKDATDELAKGMKDGELSPEEAAKIRAMVEEPAKQFNAAVTAGLGALGIEPGVAGGNTPAAKSSFSNMKEETGSAILGQFTALRMSNAIVADILRDEAGARKTLYLAVADIADNTYQSAQSLKSIDKRLMAFETDGIKLR